MKEIRFIPCIMITKEDLGKRFQGGLIAGFIIGFSFAFLSSGHYLNIFMASFMVASIYAIIRTHAINNAYKNSDNFTYKIEAEGDDDDD